MWTGEIVLFVLTFGRHKPRWDLYAREDAGYSEYAGHHVEDFNVSVDTASLITAIGTAFAAVFTACAAGFTAWQAQLIRKTIQAQTFVAITEKARSVHFSKTMDLIRSLDYRDYDEFKNGVRHEQQEAIRDVVDFLNDVQHMIDSDYVSARQILRIYFLSIRACAERLLPWWLHGFRKDQGSLYYYENFERLCEIGLPHSGSKRCEVGPGSSGPRRSTSG